MYTWLFEVVVKFEKYFTTKGTKFFHKAHKKVFVNFVVYFLLWPLW
jgi:hypothetical protein